MPFQSEKQRRYLWANEPEIARDWADTYGSRIEKNSGGISQLVKSGQGRPGYAGKNPFEETKKAGKSYERATAPGGEGAAAWQERALQTHRQEQQAQGKGAEQRAAEEEAKRYKESARGKKEIKTAAVRNKRLAKIRNIKPKGTWTQKLGYGILPNNPKLALEFLSTLKDEDQELWDNLPQNLKDLIAVDQSGMDLRKWEDHPDISYENWNMLTQIPEYGKYLSERGKPGVLHGGNIGHLGDKFVKKDEFGKPMKDRYGNTLYGYREHKSGEGPSYEAWKVAQGGGGGGGATVPSPVEDTPSAFQASLTTGTDTPNYYVGSNPLASNIAWGKQAGVDPRTMGIYNQDQFGFPTWAAEGGRIPAAFGGIMDTETGRRAYGLGSIFKKIGRAAKKVFKSPIGKAALLGGAGWLLGGGGIGSWGGWGGGFGKSPVAGWFGKKGPLAGLVRKKLKDDTYGGLSWGKLGIMGASALPFFMGGGDDDKDEGFDYDAAKNAYRDELMRIKRGSMAGSLDPNEFSYLPTYKDGGRIGLSNGGDPLLREEYEKYVFEMKEMELEPMTFEEFLAQARAGMYAGGQSTPSDYTMEDAMMTTTQDKLGGITDVMKQADLNRQGSVGQFYAADGGRIGYDAGGQTGHPPITTGQVPQVPPQMPAPQAQRPHPMPAPQPNRMAGMNPMMNPMGGRRMAQEGGLMDMGGRIGYRYGKTYKDKTDREKFGTALRERDIIGLEPYFNLPDEELEALLKSIRPSKERRAKGRSRKQEGGLMDMGGMEKDYRNDGGFVPIGGKEKADDVPARLSKNEFVFTADAVRGAGDGDIDKGAEVMENIMKNLEQGGQISEETQGLSGAQEMFGVSERLSEVV